MQEIIKDKSKLNDRADETILADEGSLNETISEIKEILYANDELVALSAPMIGVNKRLFCIKFNGGDIRTFINPMVIKFSGLHLSIENNASIEGEYMIPRYDEIEATYQTPTGVIESNAFKSYPGEVFQQMVYTLDGVYIDDFGLEIVPEFYDATDEVKQEIVNMYIDSLKQSKKDIDDEIESNDDLKKISSAIDFMTGVATGKVTLEKVEPKLNREQRRAKEKLEKVLKRKASK